MNHADDLIYKEHVYDRLNEQASPPSDFKDLKDGDVFDLGGVTLQVYSAAGHTPGQKEILSGVIQVCEDIRTGKADNMPYEFMGQQVIVAKKINAFLQHLDGGIGNIAYTKEN
jgi:hypothetical protein